MKSFVSSLALVTVAASVDGAAAAAEPSPPDLASSARDLLAELSAALELPPPPRDDAARLDLDAGSWQSALACTADLDGQQPGLVDQDACATVKTEDGGACVWCDAASLLGRGVCVAPGVKDSTGQLWDAVCGGAAAADAAPEVAAPEVAAPAAPTPADGLPDVLKCSLDDSMSVVDEASCAARQDADGQGCVWCGVSFLGTGACTTSGGE